MSAQKQTGRRAEPQVAVQIDDPAWRELGTGLVRQIRRAAQRALVAAGPDKAGKTLSILLTGDQRVHELNREYRGKDRATNVLSFPSPAPDYLGDIAIAYGVTAKEAEAGGLPLLHHLLHLTVHGVLHLLGYDHEAPKDADVMEAREADILAGLNIPNPYTRRGRAA